MVASPAPQEIVELDVIRKLVDRAWSMRSFDTHRSYVRQVIANELDRSAIGTDIVQAPLPASSPTLVYRQRMDAQSAPSEKVAAGYRWHPGTELAATPAPVTH